MSQNTAIQWTDATWNIARGCTKVDEDCKYCYMYRDSMDSTRYNPLVVVRTKTVFDMPLRYKETKSSVSEKGVRRMHQLARIPAAKRFISFEPLHQRLETNWDLSEIMAFDWVIIGGESGNDTGKYRYRPCELAWMEELAAAFDSCGIPVFVKQMGTHLSKVLGMSDRHGSKIEEFPLALRKREFPHTDKPEGLV